MRPQATSARAVTASTVRSSRSNIAGGAVSRSCFASQLLVKLGMIRPPTKLMSMSSVATPRRLPNSAVREAPIASR
jgi:hypothetical protein